MRGPQWDNEDFAFAVDSFGPSVYRLAYNQLLSQQAAEDIYQEVFTALFTSQKAFENDYHLKSWLLKVTANRCKNARRNSAKRLEVPFDTTEENMTSLTAELHQQPDDFADSSVGEIVDDLSQEFRVVIHLHYVEGYSTEEIAEATGTSATTVRTRLFRARRKIKLAIESR